MEEEHRGHREERPASEGGPYKNEKGIGELGHLKVAATLAEEPAEEGLLPGGAVYFGYGFG